MAELLFWPAVVAYGEAALAFGLGPGRPARLGTWGVRLGWLVQTALLGLQADRADGFPWASWAGSLNLFVWLVVGAYLIWGCNARYRLIGLGVMPLAAALFLLARIGGGTGVGARSDYGNLFLVIHVGLVLAAFAGFTLAAALAGLYLWQERRLKRRPADILRMRMPSLVTLELLTARTIGFALPALTLGIVAGAVRLAGDGGGIDALMVVTFLTWALYGSFVLVRPTGRRAAQLALVGFALVIVVRLGLPLTHFS
ncbi:MAG TPA: cytochrome c biogenesis protein CcsA [Gaiellaceae bacterium]|nr:cytochrome c biogenesis protein CcsA [Gaiellaceae bacterium]